MCGCVWIMSSQNVWNQSCQLFDPFSWGGPKTLVALTRPSALLAFGVESPAVLAQGNLPGVLHPVATRGSCSTR